jgi:hypothetical protein
MARLLSTRSAATDACRTLSSRSVSGTVCRLSAPFHGHHDRFGLAPGIRDVALRVQPFHCDTIVPFHVLAPSWSSSNIVRESNASIISATLFLVVFHRTLGLEFAARVAPRDSDHHRTDAGQSPDATSDSTRTASAGLMPHPRATLDGSTRLGAERPTAPRREPVSSRRPASRMFSISI